MSRRRFYVLPGQAGTWQVLLRRRASFHDPHARGQSRIRDCAPVVLRSDLSRADALALATDLNRRSISDLDALALLETKRP